MSGTPTREQALALHRAGRLGDAERAYRALLQQTPGDAAITHALCVLLLQSGRDAEAQTRLEALLRMQNVPPAWVLLAQLRRRQGRVGEALAAIAAARAAGLADPGLDALHGTLLAAAGDDAAAEPLLQGAVQRQPALPEAWHVLGQIRHRAGRWNEAIAAYREALRRTPDDAALHFNLGLSAEAAGDLELAREGFDAALRRAPQRIEALGRLAAVQARLFDTAGEAASVAALERELGGAAAGDTVEPFLLTFLPLSTAARRNGLARYEHNLRAAVRGQAIVPSPPRGARARLRIGYLSPDLGHHAVGGLMRDVFAAHDRGRVEVYAYSQRRHSGDTADAIRAGCDVFRDVAGHDAAATAQTIGADALDVLIDLGGYTRGADGRVLALRPAPRQVSYLGFIQDHGAEWIDALLLDAEVAPDPSIFSHRVLHLPGTLLPGGRAMPAPAADRAAFELPHDAPVFASFNTSYKLDAAVLDAWLAIHRAAPQAVFLLVLPPQTRARVLAAWRAGGGDAAALRFGEPLAPQRHAVRAASCDLLLDTFRYHAGATAIASAAAGLPVLCVPGALPLARLSASVNRFLGLDALVCASRAEYVERAVALAHDRARLQALRASVHERAQARGLFDPRRTAAGIEDALDTLP
ncbi:tetratricopeptide repeat protein [Chiayiivirga flava]|uniref:protein O-GlcNAc transferase n=1 Tax=Chiayiivirga flava TaxID=659595 RepID=A0A7W8D3U0_9GAMM|nr:glycosyltransferase family 41 protein [Chiayiivirga flava]MBB5207445.1 putative O-linked N-acetylglucosamine transferase (SPINDLY family) [Chiayiivirga flava]